MCFVIVVQSYKGMAIVEEESRVPLLIHAHHLTLKQKSAIRFVRVIFFTQELVIGYLGISKPDRVFVPHKKDVHSFKCINYASAAN